MDSAKMRSTNDETKQIWNDLMRAMHRHSCVLNAAADGRLDENKSGKNVSHLSQEFFLKTSQLRRLNTLEDFYGICNDEEGNDE